MKLGNGTTIVRPADKLWDGNFTLGLDGSEGNSETFNFRFGFHAKRKTDNTVLTLGLDYNKQTAHTIATTNHLFFDGRDEWMFTESRWSWFRPPDGRIRRVQAVQRARRHRPRPGLPAD